MSPPPERGGAIYSTFLLLVSLGILTAGGVAFMKASHTNPLSPAFLEQAPPQVSLVQPPLGIGADAVPLKILVEDSGAGFDEVIVRISQRNQPKELLRKRYEGGAPVHSQVFDLAINGKELGLREGNAELQVLAFDRSLWSNGATVSKLLPVNFIKPHITVVTPQQNGVLGGSELVFYKILGKQPKVQGVVSKNALFSGFPASEWDPTFKSYDSLYVALFPIPPSFRPGSDSMQLIARDDIGNSTSAPFNYRIRQRKWSAFKVSLPEQGAKQLRDRLAAFAQRSGIPVQLGGDLSGDLRALLRALHTFDETGIAESLRSPEAKRHWSGAFIKPVSATPSSSFGDMRTVVVGGSEVLKSQASGVRMAVRSRTPVMAANAGKVAFAGELGELGLSVIIDHGFGLATVYGHLSETSAAPGSVVAKNQPIGRTGTSGLALSEEVYFEVRLHGVPVSPNEWWDESWVTDHIDNKVAFVRTEVVGGAGE